MLLIVILTKVKLLRNAIIWLVSGAVCVLVFEGVGKTKLI